MLFTTLGRIVAGIALVLGAFRIAIAIWAINEPAAKVYLGTSTTGEALDKGLLVVVFAISLGVVTDISRSIAKANQAGAGTT